MKVSHSTVHRRHHPNVEMQGVQRIPRGKMTVVRIQLCPLEREGQEKCRTLIQMIKCSLRNK